VSDDASQLYLDARNVDPELEGDLARFKDVSRKSSSRGFLERTAGGVGEGAAFEGEGISAGVGKLGEFIHHLPRNVTVGVMDAAISTWGLAEDINELAMTTAAKIPGAADSTKQAAEKAKADPAYKPAAVSPELQAAAIELRGALAQNSGTADELTQSASQFFIPFTSFSKLLGGLKGANSLRTVARVAGAEVATMMTAFEPHEARFADLLRMTNTNNELVNAYINYLSADADEGEWEGRFKNSVDSLATSAAIATVIKTGGIALKQSRKALALPEPKPALAGAQ
jgi:hypothetical protein